MHLIHKAYIRKADGEYIITQNCRIHTKDIDFARQQIYAEVQPDYLPEIIYIDLAYVDSANKEELFKLTDTINNPRKRVTYGDTRAER